MRIYVMTRKGIWLFDNDSETPVSRPCLTNWQITDNVANSVSLAFVHDNTRLSDPPAIMSYQPYAKVFGRVYVPNTFHIQAKAVPEISIGTEHSVFQTRHGLVTADNRRMNFMYNSPHIDDIEYIPHIENTHQYISEDYITVDIVTGDLISMSHKYVNSRFEYMYVRYAEQGTQTISSMRKLVCTAVAIGQSLYTIGSYDIAMVDWRMDKTRIKLSSTWYNEINNSRAEPKRLMTRNRGTYNTRAVALTDTTIAIATFPVWTGINSRPAAQTVQSCMFDTRWPTQLVGIYPDIDLPNAIGTSLSACIRV